MKASPIDKCLAANPQIILFDGLCNLCSGWVQFLIARDPAARLRFCSVQSAEGQALLTHIGLHPTRIETMAYIDHGQAYLHSDAFFAVIAELPRPWRWLTLGRYIPRPLRDGLYRLIARNRYRIAGKKDQCLLPSEAQRYPPAAKTNFET
ncbi:thiol-disulfide oxidoreductase DCC family protein [Saccharospirillum impatiens]|uniref:thiol-disulfide oxidoreductase DCC family protein n=1 Tax=Saccharospirillum impatiens TaxID=169438 RepID=UPI0005624603|nr:thiol-disulfide oxidoreductase DCC family protein [Saccharospirillum impatiens]